MFEKYSIFIYFFYGLAFLLLGVVSLIEGRRKSEIKIISSLPLLGYFGLLHGFAELAKMFSLLPSENLGITIVFLEKFEAFSVISSFIFLLLFGTKLINKNLTVKWGTYISTTASLAFILSLVHIALADPFAERIDNIIIYARYFFAFPGAVMGGIGILLESKNLENGEYAEITNIYKSIAYALLAYSVLGGLIVTPHSEGLANILNTDVFLHYVGIPIQIFRAACAVALAILSVKSLDIYEFENKKTELEKIKYLKNLSIRDEVSGLHNHRYFQEKLSEFTLRTDLLAQNFSLLLLDIDHFKKYNDTFGHPMGDKLLKELGSLLLLMTSKNDIVARYGGDELVMLLPDTDKTSALEFANGIRKKIELHPFSIDDFNKGNFVTVSIGVATFPEMAINKDFLIQVADFALYKAKKYRNRVELYSSILDELKSDIDSSEIGLINSVKTLITVINAKDQYTFGHSERVMAFSVRIAKRMCLSEQDIKTIQYGAYLHDIGKIEIERELLNKKEPLTKEEYDKIKSHPEMGANILIPIKSLQEVIPSVRYHHERYDGLGYPTGNSGKNIPLYARIIAVADSFDAMTTTRPYKTGKCLEEALVELQNCSGTQFDPDIVSIFVNIIRENGHEYECIINAS